MTEEPQEKANRVAREENAKRAIASKELSLLGKLKKMMGKKS